MNHSASLTALLSAFARAYHTEHETAPVFADPIAKKLITADEYTAICEYILSGIDFFAPEKKRAFTSHGDALRYLVYTQIAPTPLARARFCEDSLKTAVLTGTKQYVILGAGMDSFSFREPEFMKNCKVFEADHPLTQSDKIERIQRAGLTIPDNVYFIPIDFRTDDLKKKLLHAGFERNKKTLFSWLGVSYYLSINQIENLLDSLADISAEGSSLIFDYADEKLFLSDQKRVQNMISLAAAGGEPMISCFGYAALEKLLERHRFLIYELLSDDDIQQNYFTGRGTDLSAFEHISLVNAVLK